MSYGICILATAPGRKEASDRSEMVTQFLFGEQFEVIEQETKWSFIRAMHDDYECWLDNKQWQPIDAPIKGKRSLEMLFGTNELRVPFGALLPDHHENSFQWNGERVGFKGAVGPLENSELFAHNAKWLNTPYLWGGRSVFGVDCSGLVQVMFSTIGVDLPRDAYQQAEIGETVQLIGLTKPGDLAYFDNEEGAITHVGVIVEEGKILHASGKVRIDPIDQEGIFNSEKGDYSHKLRLIKRIL